MLLTISMILRLVLKCSKLHANLVDLMDKNAVKALKGKKMPLQSDLETNVQ